MRKTIKYTRHAKNRMKWRKVTQSEVERVLCEPDRTENTESGRRNAFKKIGDRNIRVTFQEIADSILVISAVEKRQ